jgi:formylglycine-generating enzyme required for sulfatase activity
MLERIPGERPQHRVRVTKPIYLGLGEVTQLQYERVVGSNPSQFKDDPTHPVENVHWDEASAFCRKLAELPQERESRAEYRLPTEAEWEYACRAGTTTTWYSGDDVDGLNEHAWFNNNAGGKTHPVRQKSPNAWGLYDMHGNLWEWCNDWYDAAYYGKSPTDDPPGAPGGSHRVSRGGSWFDMAVFGRSAFRPFTKSETRANNLGFRLARIVSSSSASR